MHVKCLTQEPLLQRRRTADQRLAACGHRDKRARHAQAAFAAQPQLNGAACMGCEEGQRSFQREQGIVLCNHGRRHGHERWCPDNHDQRVNL
jgi:hypothetical protein